MDKGESEVQRTPTGHEIPVPSREEVLRDLAKVARAEPPEPSEDESDGRGSGPEEQ
jgi:hypothetical protein